MRPSMVLALVATVLSGCMADDGPTTGGSTTTPVTTSCSGAACPAEPTPVAIDETFDITTGADKTWRWNVSAGYTSFTVRLDGTGPGGAGNFVLQDFEYRLAGPNGPEGAQASGATQSSSGNLITYDGAGLADVGAWELRFRTGPGAGSFHATVTVEY